MMAFGSDFVRDVRYGVRTLTKHRRFSGVAILTIALAVAANAVAFAVLKTVLDPLPYGHAVRLVALVETDNETPNPQTASYATVRDWAARSSSFDSIATWSDAAVRFIRPDGVDMVRGMQVSASFFETLGVPMALGRPFHPAEDRQGADHVLILTHDTWTTLFAADPAIIGRTVSTMGGPYTIVGVLPSDFHPLHMSNPAELPRTFVPYDSSQASCRTAPCRRVGAIARLKPGISVEQARVELRTVTQSLAREYADQYPNGESALVVPLREQVVGRFETAAWIVELAVALLLALACANVAMLLLARTLSRQSEFAVRVALGASRWDIVRQLLAEGLLLALAGGAVGGSVAWWTTRAIARTSGANIPRIGELVPDASILTFALAVSIIVAAAAGLAPAIATFRRAFVTMRESSGITPHSYQLTMRILVGVELALAFVLVTLVGVLGMSYLRLMDVDRGFDASGVLTLSLLPDGVHYRNQDQRLAWFDAVAARMRAIPGVEDAGYASTLPLSHPSTFPLFIREHPLRTVAPPVLDTYLVSPNYVHIMRIPVLAGRDFAPSDNARTESVALVSQSAARLYFGGQSAIGQHLQIDERRVAGPWARVVGIVRDVHQYGLDLAADPAVYVLFDQARPAPQGWASLVVRSQVPPDQIESAVRAAMREVDPLQPIFHMQPMTTYIALSVSQRTFALALIAAIGAVALALATGGVYGVVSYIVEQRTREVGLRLALGASAESVRRLIAGQIVAVALVAIGSGVGIAAAVGGAISSLLFGVRPLDPSIIASVAALIVVITLAASAVPAWRASRTDPMASLRAD
ncbi:MAG TPA: ADOP family duplicated permease [Vicinamibacterales bacterium]|nr:ADOP family duplicated permease [Vicinamibacterales bacterium]